MIFYIICYSYGRGQERGSSKASPSTRCQMGSREARTWASSTRRAGEVNRGVIPTLAGSSTANMAASTVCGHEEVGNLHDLVPT